MINREDGLTIGQRLDIVKMGNTSNRVSACIRLTSNCFGASIHRYMELLHIDPKFDIRDLRSIG